MNDNTTLPAPSVIPNADVISPAEAKFWQEWADHTPELIRKRVAAPLAARSHNAYSVAAFSVGAVLGVASFTRFISGKWKWASGAASIGSLVGGATLKVMDNRLDRMQQTYAAYADTLEKTPGLTKELAIFLSRSVTAEDIRANGIENAVIMRAVDFDRIIPWSAAKNAAMNGATR